MNELNSKDPYVFVAMPFSGSEFTEVYQDVIKPAVENCGLSCKRSDEIFDTDIIIESIENDIRDCLLAIGDLTGRNPNVFYEIGFARALDKEVILLTQKADDVPFDLQHRRYIQYGITGRQLAQIQSTLEKTLTAVIPRAKRAEAMRAAAQDNPVNFKDEVAALRAQIKNGLENLHQELHSVIQNTEEGIDSPTPVFQTARLNSVRAACLSNLKQLGLAAMQYIQDNGEKFPDHDKWQDALLPYVRNSILYKCPGAPDLEFGYAMNKSLSGQHLMLLEDTSRTPLFFDCSLGQANASGGMGDLCDPPRHLGKNNIVFADGHVEMLKADDRGKLIWTPDKKMTS